MKTRVVSRLRETGPFVFRSHLRLMVVGGLLMALVVIAISAPPRVQSGAAVFVNSPVLTVAATSNSSITLSWSAPFGADSTRLSAATICLAHSRTSIPLSVRHSQILGDESEGIRLSRAGDQMLQTAKCLTRATWQWAPQSHSSLACCWDKRLKRDIFMMCARPSMRFAGSLTCPSSRFFQRT